MFKAIGILVAVYALYAAFTGKVYAKSGIRARVVTREDSPQYFWVVVVIYLALGVALLTIF